MARKRTEDDIIINDPSIMDMQEMHESKNPQLIAQRKLLNAGATPLDNVSINNEYVEVIEEHNEPLIGFENEYMSIEATTDIINQQVLKQNEAFEKAMQEKNLELENEEAPFEVIDNNDNQAPINITIQQEDTNDKVVENMEVNEFPRTQTISKENFSRFVNSLDILKNIKQNVIFENGITCFVSDNKVYICKFDIHCPEISFKIPFVEQQASQLSFLTKGNAVSILESEDDYIFNEGQFKFQLRKTIADDDTWNVDIFNKLYNNIINKPLIAQYEFTDKGHLDKFLSIIKGVKRNSIDIYNTNNNELVFDRGEVNSGKFELLRIPCNLSATNNQDIKSIIDSVCLLNDYQTMNMSFYYNGSEQDSISIVINGRLKDDYDITFICNVHRHYQQ